MLDEVEWGWRDRVTSENGIALLSRAATCHLPDWQQFEAHSCCSVVGGLVVDISRLSAWKSGGTLCSYSDVSLTMTPLCWRTHATQMSPFQPDHFPLQVSQSKGAPRLAWQGQRHILPFSEAFLPLVPPLMPMCPTCWAKLPAFAPFERSAVRRDAERIGEVVRHAARGARLSATVIIIASRSVAGGGWGTGEERCR